MKGCTLLTIRVDFGMEGEQISPLLAPVIKIVVFEGDMLGNKGCCYT